MKNSILLIFIIIIANQIFAQKFIAKKNTFTNSKLSEIVNYNKYGKITYKKTKIFNEPERWLIEQNNYENNTLSMSANFINENNIANYYYFYNHKNLLYKIINKEKDSIISENLFRYNNENLLVNECLFENNLKKQEINYFYNHNKQIATQNETYFASNDSATITKKIIYNSNGGIERICQTNTNNTMSDICYTYNKHLQKKSQTIIAQNDTLLKIVWKYKKNNTTPYIELHFIDGYIVRQTKFTYKKNKLFKENTIEYRNYEGKMKPIKTIKKHQYIWEKDE